MLSSLLGFLNETPRYAPSREGPLDNHPKRDAAFPKDRVQGIRLDLHLICEFKPPGCRIRPRARLCTSRRHLVSLPFSTIHNPQFTIHISHFTFHNLNSYGRRPHLPSQVPGRSSRSHAMQCFAAAQLSHLTPVSSALSSSGPASRDPHTAACSCVRRSTLNWEDKAEKRSCE
jgi:hypothetical protein